VGELRLMQRRFPCNCLIHLLWYHWLTTGTLCLKVAPRSNATKFSSYGDNVSSTVDSQFDDFLDSWFMDFMRRHPMEALGFGLQIPGCGHASHNPQSSDLTWGNASTSMERRGIDVDIQRLEQMRQRFGSTIGKRPMSDERRITYDLMQKKVQEMEQDNLYEDIRVPFGPLGCKIGLMGCQVRVVGLLRGFAVSSVEDAECYISLLHGLPTFLGGHTDRLLSFASHGVIAYSSVLEAVAQDCKVVLPATMTSTAPDPRNSSLYQDFQAKLARLSRVDKAITSKLLHKAEGGIVNGLWVAYGRLHQVVTEVLIPSAPQSTYGIGTIYGQKGKDYYNYRVGLMGIGLNASGLHQHALHLVQENERQMKDITSNLSSISAFHHRMKGQPPDQVRVQYQNTDNGRTSYMKDIRGNISSLWQALNHSASSDANLFSLAQDGGRLFLPEDLPALPCKVLRIWSPSFPGIAQYSQGSIRPIRRDANVAFNVNNMTVLNADEMVGLAAHEVVPGHHLQTTKTLSLPLPGFRRYFGEEAFSEGWAVYAEQNLARRFLNISQRSELGLVNLRQLRAIRLAVDTGIHHHGWNRGQAQNFYLAHATIDPVQAQRAADRHFAWPGQALTYMVGYEQVLRVRSAVMAQQDIKKRLGSKWEQYFHHALLSHGDLPLNMVEQVVLADMRAVPRL